MKKNENSRCLISQWDDISWSAERLDLSPCDYFWEYLEAQIIKRESQTTDELKDLIHREAVAVPESLTWRTDQNLRVRLHEFIARGSKHLEGIIFENKLMKITKPNSF